MIKTGAEHFLVFPSNDFKLNHLSKYGTMQAYHIDRLDRCTTYNKMLLKHNGVDNLMAF